MRQWWGMRRLGHTLSSKTQLVANDTTFSARGLGLWLQTRGHNGLNYGLNGYASQSTNKDTHTCRHPCTHTRTQRKRYNVTPQIQIHCMITLNQSKPLHNACKNHIYSIPKHWDSVHTRTCTHTHTHTVLTNYTDNPWKLWDITLLNNTLSLIIPVSLWHSVRIH